MTPPTPPPPLLAPSRRWPSLAVAVPVAAAARPRAVRTLRSARRSCAYAERHVGVVRRDDRPRDRPARRQPRRPTARASVQTSTTNIGAYMWSTVVAEELGHHRPRRGGRAARRPRSGRSRRWSATSRAASSTTGTTTRPARSSPPGRRPATRSPRSCRRSTTAGWRPACRSSPTPSRRSPTGPAALYDSMDFGFYYRPEVNRIAFHVAPDTGAFAVLLRHDRQREPDRELHRHRQGRAPGQGVLRRLADVPRHLRLELAGDEAGRLHADLPRRQRLRGRLPVRGLPRRARAGAAACSRR